MECQQSDYFQGSQIRFIEKVHVKVARTQNAFQNTKMREEKMLRDYMNPLSKTTTFIQAAKMKVESEADMRQRLREK